MAVSRQKRKRVQRTRTRKKPARRKQPFQLEDHQIDLVALGMIAVAIFLGSIFYFGWAGGKVGELMRVLLSDVFGITAYLAPLALGIAGALLIGRLPMERFRSYRTGFICVVIGVTLAVSAGSFGVGPSDVATSSWLFSDLAERGGLVGRLLYWFTDLLVQRIGTDLIVVFLLCAGGLQLSGASLSGVARRCFAGVLRGLRRSSPQLPRSRSKPPRRVPTAALDGPEPELAVDQTLAFDPVADLPLEPIVRATHVEAPGVPACADDLTEVNDSEPEDRERTVVQGALTPQGRYRADVTDDPNFAWKLPDARQVLVRSNRQDLKPDTSGQAQMAAALVEALGHFGVDAKVVGTVTGPHITRYELRLAPGTKVGKVAKLKDDLAYALAATEIRILAPIPGKRAVGVEVPNSNRKIVHLGDVFQASPKDWSPLSVWLGKDVSGRAIGADLAKMPHILVAGTTGAGKSGCVNAMLSSILLKSTPHEVRMVLVDPKQVELNHYESLPHLLTPVITSPRMAANALQNLVREMEERYGMMSLARTRSLNELNKERLGRGQPPLPYILCVIDELADLMMVAPADVEDAIIRLAQKARAVGIHLVLATQSPRVDVITGMIKANVPSRIAFSVSSQIDSRVILDQNGAESLLGQGDMLFAPVGSSKLQRIQGAYIDENQIRQLTDWWRRQGEPEFQEQLLEEVSQEGKEEGGQGNGLDRDDDPLLSEAITMVVQLGTASTSMLQRRLRVGYTRAGRLVDMLERRGVVSGYEGSKARQVLITEADLPRILGNIAEPTPS